MEGMRGFIDYASSSAQPNQEPSPFKLPPPRSNESGGILCPIQTLDQFHQFNVQQQQQQTQRQVPRGPDPDPDLAPLETAAAAITGLSNSIVPASPPQPEANNVIVIRYRECQKNHAASMGGHVVDGCGEFMPSGDEGTAEVLRCAACECHRSFHRRVIEGGESQQYPNGNNTIRRANSHYSQPSPSHHRQTQNQFSRHYSQSLATPATGPTMMAFRSVAGRVLAESSSEDLNMFQSIAGGGQNVAVPPSVSGSKKRFRTKFTQQQKDRMQEVAEKLGWRIQKQDDEEVQRLCDELGVKRQVFKVWMHNNKQAMKKKQDE